jgi:hypothetical protein
MRSPVGGSHVFSSVLIFRQLKEKEKKNTRDVNDCDYRFRAAHSRVRATQYNRCKTSYKRTQLTVISRPKQITCEFPAAKICLAGSLSSI